VERVGALAVLDDARNKNEDGGQDHGVAAYGGAEDDDDGGELEEEADEVAEPKLVVLEGVGGDGVGAAQVEQQERRPEGKNDGAAAAAAHEAHVVEDEAEREVGHPVGEEVAGPDGEAEVRGGGALACWAEEDEEDLEKEAQQHPHPDLPVAVLLRHPRLEAHCCRWPPIWPSIHAFIEN